MKVSPEAQLIYERMSHHAKMSTSPENVQHVLFALGDIRLDRIAYSDFFNSVACLFTEGVEFMSREDIYFAIKSDFKKAVETIRSDATPPPATSST